MKTYRLKNIENYPKDTDPGPFSKNNGFLYNLELDGIFYKGFTVEEINCNKAGIAHGGTLIAFADGIMGYTAWKKDSFPCLTAKLNANYVGPAPKGSWVYGFAENTRETKSILFMKCNLFIDDKIIFTSDGICLLYTSPSPRDKRQSRMPSSA